MNRTLNHTITIEQLCDTSPPHYAEELARIHSSQLPDGFLTRMGTPFLTKFYKCLTGSPHAFIFVATADAKVVGFICGALNTSHVYKDLLVHASWSLIPDIVSAACSPRKLLGFLEIFLYPRKKVSDLLPKSELLNFCVVEGAQGRGIGHILFEALVNEFRARTVSRIRIVTSYGQTRARKFYETRNARKIDEIEVHRGKKSLVYLFEITEDDQLQSTLSLQRSASSE